ncbi:hypothetical protein TWF696_001831 [Orbilia brochopaga]|uniref:Glycosyltransferase family 31 protein n=1 Tax=Orbilia brochopaga TaxID=3140254 RepID=A0AAV9U916_9PEZI
MMAHSTTWGWRRSPLLVCSIVVLFVLLMQSWFLFRYNVRVSALLHPFDGLDAALPAYAQPATYTVTITKAAPTVTVTEAAPIPSAVPAEQLPKTPAQVAPLHDVVLSIKTGGTVIFNRVPIQLLTFVQYFPNTLVYSDLKTKLGDWEVTDALSHISADVAGDSLKHWRTMQELNLQGAGLADAEGKVGDLKEGWALDRFKNVPIMIETYRRHPRASYYLFIDGDTSMVTSNWWPFLLELTKKHDPLSSPIYQGSASNIGSFSFGHGGSGYLINQAAMRKMFPKGMVDQAFLDDLERNYTKVASHSCCGDVVLAHAMVDRGGMPIDSKGPFFQGDSWWNVPWKEDNFCKPVGTMHHHLPEDMQEMWEFEQAMLRKNDMWRPAGWTPQHEQGVVKWRFTHMPPEVRDMNLSDYKHILYRDMYDWFVAQRLPREVTREEGEDWGDSAVRIGWDNRSWTEGEFNEDRIKEMEGEVEQWKKDAFTSEKDCRLACEKHMEKCLQWFYRKDHCGYSEHLKYGRRLPHDGKASERRERGVSGWIPRRIEEEEKKWRAKCPG